MVNFEIFFTYLIVLFYNSNSMYVTLYYMSTTRETFTTVYIRTEVITCQ